MKINDDAEMAIIYISDENKKNHELIFKGRVKDFRNAKEVGDFDRLKMGDAFTLTRENNDTSTKEKVRIYKIDRALNTEEVITKIFYLVGPHDLNVNKMDLEDFHVDDYI